MDLLNEIINFRPKVCPISPFYDISCQELDCVRILGIHKYVFAVLPCQGVQEPDIQN